MLSSPRKGPEGLWIQGKLVLSPAWEQAVCSFRKGSDGAGLTGSTAWDLGCGQCPAPGEPPWHTAHSLHLHRMDRAIPHPSLSPNHLGMEIPGAGSCPFTQGEAEATRCAPKSGWCSAAGLRDTAKPCPGNPG